MSFENVDCIGVGWIFLRVETNGRWPCC